MIPAHWPAVFSKLDGLTRFLAPLLPAPRAAAARSWSCHRRRSGHPQDMETGRPPDCRVYAAVHVHYLSTGGARAAAVLAADAAFSQVLAERAAAVPRVPPYRPGGFYRRELPPLRAVLDGLSGLGLLAVDGYADLDPGGRPGRGAHAHAASGIPVMGVAKSRFRAAAQAVPVLRGTSVRPVFVTVAGMPIADAADLVRRMTVSAARRVAPRRHARTGGSARSPADRPSWLTHTNARIAACADGRRDPARYRAGAADVQLQVERGRRSRREASSR
jgi:deoxyribonuclease V